MTNTHTSADRELVSKKLTGDRHAFGMLVGQTERLVAQMVCKMIPNPADRKDIDQDVYLKVYSSFPKFRFQSKLSTYVGQVTCNTCLHYLEKKRLVLLHGFISGDMEKELDQLMLNAGSAPEKKAETRLFSKDAAQGYSFKKVSKGRIMILHLTEEQLQLYAEQPELAEKQVAAHFRHCVLCKTKTKTTAKYIYRFRRWRGLLLILISRGLWCNSWPLRNKNCRGW